MKTRTMAAGKFKAQCLAVLDEVQAKGETVIITKRGKKVAKVVPIEKGKDDFFGSWKGKVKIVGDIVAPALSREEWGDLW